jgi:hypothetical protein
MFLRLNPSGSKRFFFEPIPIPNTNLPVAISLKVAKAAAVTAGCREYGFVTPVPRWMDFVLRAQAVIIT